MSRLDVTGLRLHKVTKVKWGTTRWRGDLSRELKVTRPKRGSRHLEPSGIFLHSIRFQ